MQHPMLKAGARANLCFHDIADDDSVIYTVPRTYLREVADRLRELGIARHVRFYFDDGYRSVMDAVELLGREYPEIELAAAPTIALLETPGFITWIDVGSLHARGVTICAHGREHLHLEELSEDLIEAQLSACHEALSRYAATEFVLPYGTYDQRVLAVNRRARLFTHLTTVDYAWDRGQLLRPRLMVTSQLTPEQLCARLAEPA